MDDKKVFNRTLLHFHRLHTRLKWKKDEYGREIRSEPQYLSFSEPVFGSIFNNAEKKNYEKNHVNITNSRKYKQIIPLYDQYSNPLQQAHGCLYTDDSVSVCISFRKLDNPWQCGLGWKLHWIQKIQGKFKKQNK